MVVSMKIMVVTKYNVETTLAWSGTPYFLVRQIRKMSDEVYVYQPKSMGWFRRFSKIFRRSVQMFGNSSIDLTRTCYYSRNIAEEVILEVNRVKPDVIVGVAASIELAFLETEVPIIHISDATFEAMLGYYPEFTGLWNWLKKDGHEIERRIIQSSGAIVCSSQWAKNSMISDYHACLNKIHVIPLGANIKDVPKLTKCDVNKKFEGKCKLLFVGKDWGRKGGEIVLETYRKLIEYGIDAELTVIGSKISPIPAHPNINIYAHLNKDLKEDLDIFNSIFTEASFFILPAKAEAFGIVYAEAAAFGTPVLGPNTGGVSSVVEDNVTGALLSEDASADQYAERIHELWNNKEMLYEMSLAARQRFSADLNWNRWASDFMVVIDSLSSPK